MAAAPRFPYWLDKLPDGMYQARFPQFPDFVSTDATIAKLQDHLQDDFLEYLEQLLRKAPVPAERPVRAGEEVLELTPTYGVKLMLIAACRDRKISGQELSRKLGILPQEATRILRLTHPTKIDTLHAAITAIGGRLEYGITFGD